MAFNPEQLPSCLPDMLENTNEQGEALTPGNIRPCWETCPHFKEAFPFAELTPERRQQIGAANAQGAFINCQNRRAQAGK